MVDGLPQRPIGPLRALVWYCGDDYCDCSQAQIVPMDQTLHALWQGTFFTDGQAGATTELNRTAQWLRRHHHDVYVRIEWPWDRARLRQEMASRPAARNGPIGTIRAKARLAQFRP